jgi:hypothetical protein
MSVIFQDEISKVQEAVATVVQVSVSEADSACPPPTAPSCEVNVALASKKELWVEETMKPEPSELHAQPLPKKTRTPEPSTAMSCPEPGPIMTVRALVRTLRVDYYTVLADGSRNVDIDPAVLVGHRFQQFCDTLFLEHGMCDFGSRSCSRCKTIYDTNVTMWCTQSKDLCSTIPLACWCSRCTRIHLYSALAATGGPSPDFFGHPYVVTIGDRQEYFPAITACTCG